MRALRLRAWMGVARPYCRRRGDAGHRAGRVRQPGVGCAAM